MFEVLDISYSYDENMDGKAPSNDNVGGIEG